VGARQREYVLGAELHTRILATAADTEGRHDLTDNVQAPGARTPVHLHTRYEERFWVVSGLLTVWTEHDIVVLRPGDYYAVPMSVAHAVQAGPDGARALQISSPAGFAELIARAGTPAHLATPATGLDFDLFMAVTTELGDVVLGPPGTTPADVADRKPATPPGA
jgi:mannose-6-phosphate isomerase-like protein (cupin superfamily)